MPSIFSFRPTRRLTALAAIPLAGVLATGVSLTSDSQPAPTDAATATGQVQSAGLETRMFAPRPALHLPTPAPEVTVRHVFVGRDGSPLPVLPEPTPEPEPAPEREAAPAPAPNPDPDPEPKVEPEPTPEPTPEPEPEPAPEPDGAGNGVWDRIAACESGGDWSITRGLFEGGLQFHPDTWDAFKDAGMAGAAYDASRSEQIRIAERVLDAQGWGAWPTCSAKLGLR